ncbi:MAG: hypothetical protein JWR40_4296 [Massilia sp.]|nr:hypothetical protein [Massilia sp.]
MDTLESFRPPDRGTPRRRRTRRMAGCAIALAWTCALAQEEQQNPFNGFVDTLKKSAADALKSQIDKTMSPGANSSNNVPAPQPADLNNGTAAPKAQKAAAGEIGASGGSGGSGAPSSDAVEKEISDFSSACTRNPFFSSLHDCGCMTSSYRREVLASGSTKIRATLTQKLLATCPAPKQTIYNWVNRSCESAFDRKRSDHAQFCGCSAEKFSVEFNARPLETLRLVEALRKRSMLACGLADRSHDIH